MNAVCAAAMTYLDVKFPLFSLHLQNNHLTSRASHHQNIADGA